MTLFLVLVVIASYLMAALAFLVGKTDIQLILAALCVISGTVALIGLAVLNRMASIAALMVPSTSKVSGGSEA